MVMTTVKIGQAEFKESRATHEIYLHLTLFCGHRLHGKQPPILDGKEIDWVHCHILNSPNWTKSRGRAELRWALGMELIEYSKDACGAPIISVPTFTWKDLVEMVGKEIKVAIRIRKHTPYGMRIKITNFAPGNWEGDK